MTGKPGVVSPLKDLRPDRVRNKEKVSGAVIWVGGLGLGLGLTRDSICQVTGCSHHAECRQDGVRTGECFLRSMLTGESVWLKVPRVRTVSEGEGESTKKTAPSGPVGS